VSRYDHLDDAPTPSELAQEAYEACLASGGHAFTYSRVTNEPLNCIHCGTSAEAAEAAEEAAADDPPEYEPPEPEPYDREADMFARQARDEAWLADYADPF
jgi:hypothetical protein